MDDVVRILLVDDNLDDCNLAIRELQKEFAALQVQQIGTPQEFAQALHTTDFDLVITAYRLYWTEGMMILAAVKERWPECPVVMFTAAGSEEIAVAAMKAGLDDYVLKSPDNYGRLAAAVRLALRRAEDRQARRKAETRYQRLFEGIPLGLYRTATDGHILEANSALVQMLGFPDRTSLLAANAVDLYVDHQVRQRQVKHLTGHLTRLGFEMQLRCYDGRVIWVQDISREVRDDDGQLLCYEGSLRDITQRKRAEVETQQLFKTEQARRQVAEMLRQTSMVLGSTLQLDRVLTLILEQLGEVLPYTSASVQRLQEDNLVIVASQGFAETEKVTGLVFPLEDKFPNYEVVMSKKPVAFDDATQVYPHFQTEADAWGSDRIRSWLGVPLLARDQLMGMITIDRAGVHPYDEGEIQLAMAFASQAAIALQNAQLFEELAERRVYLEAVLRSAPDAVITLDIHSNVVEWNPGAERLFGYPEAEALGRDVDDLITNSETREQAKDMMQNVLDGQELSSLELVRYRQDGSAVEVLVSGSPLVVEGRVIGIVGVYTDLSEFKRAEEALRRSLHQTARGQRVLLALGQAAQVVQRTRKLQDLYATIMDEMAKLDYRCTIFTLDDTKEYLELVYVSFDDLLLGAIRKLATGTWEGFRFPWRERKLFRETITGHDAVFAKRAEDVLSEMLPRPLRSLTSRLAKMINIEQVICAPLVAGSEVYGVMFVGGADLTELEVPAINVFASQVAIAYENTHLLEAVMTHEQELRRLSLKLVRAQEAERKRLSQELHDEMGQALTGIRINLAAIEKTLPSTALVATQERMAETIALVDEMMRQTRELALDLRPSMLDDIGLLPTLRWYVNRYGKRMQTDVSLEVAGLEERLDSEMETTLYRVVQEGLTNVARHAQATKVRIHLVRSASAVTLLIEDNGTGVSLDDLSSRNPSQRGAGLLGIRERVISMGGKLNIQSAAGQGMRLDVEIPLQQEQ